MQDANIGRDSDAWKTIEAAYNDNSGGFFPNWTKLENALNEAGVNLDSADGTALLKEIEGKYESGDMTWSELEDLLEATGTPATVIRNIHSSVVGAVEVEAIELTEMDVWISMVQILTGILNNTAKVASYFTGKGVDIGTVSGWMSPAVRASWGSYFEGGANLYRGREYIYPTGSPGSGADFPTTMEVEQSRRHDLDANVWVQNPTTTVNLATAWWQLFGRIASNTYGSYRNSGYLNDLMNASSYSLSSAWLARGGVRTNDNFQFASGGIAVGPETGYAATLHGTEAIIPLKNMAVPVEFMNGGSTQAGANSEEIVLLREMVSLQKEQIDTLKAKDTSPTVNVNVDSQGIIQEAGKYVSEKSRRGTLDVRTH